MKIAPKFYVLFYLFLLLSCAKDAPQNIESRMAETTQALPVDKPIIELTLNPHGKAPLSALATIATP